MRSWLAAFTRSPCWLHAIVLSSAGCGGGGEPDPPDAPDLVTCESFTNAGATITPSSDPGAPPSMTGGTLVEGTYVLTSFIEFNGGSASSTHQETFVFEAGIVHQTASNNGGAMTVLGGTYATAGTTLTLALQCPQVGTVALQYTATATELAFIAPNNPDQLQTYTKQ